jgi:tetratricopeptide (TPR) repeat protein
MTNRRRLALAAAVAALAVAGGLFGGVLRDRGDPAPLPAPPRAVAGVVDPQRELETLLEGFSTGDTARFVRTLEANLKRDSADVSSLALLGLAYQQRARETGDPAFYSLSERALERAGRLRPDQPLVTTGLAALAVARHEFREAEALARRALEQNPDDASALAALGDALVALGRHEEAFEVFDRLIVLSPSVGSYARIAYARELLGRPDAAIRALDAALDLRLDVPEHAAYTRVQLGNLYFGTGRYARAAEQYRAGLATVPDYVHAVAGLARVDAARRDYDTAAARLEDVVARLPTPEYAALRGDVLYAAGRADEAAEAYALVEAMSSLYEANGVRTDLQTALFELDLGTDVDGAVERARAAYERAPGLTAADALAWGLFKQGRCQEARGRSMSALRLGTLDALLLYHRGVIEHCVGNESAARTFLRRALELNPNFSFVHAPRARRLLEELEA